jgi:hypothetical protein
MNSVVAILATFGFAIPILIMIATRGDHLALVHEALTFCYFATIRILNGEGGEIWLPHGQIITVLQQMLVLALHYAVGWSFFDLKPMIYWYAMLTNIAMAVLYGCVTLAAAFDSRLGWFDRAIVTLIGPFVVLVTGFAGFYYMLMPAYYALDIIIVTASAYLALAMLRDPQPYCTQDILIAGIIWGLAAANKLTMLGPAGLAVIMAAIKPPSSILKFAARVGAAALIAISAFLTVFLICYRFSLIDARTAFVSWFGFFTAAGPEPGFWEGNFRVLLNAYHYDIIAFAWSVAMILVAAKIAWHKLWLSRITALWVGVLAVATLLCLGLMKRGASTTLFEVATVFAGLAAMMFAAALGPRPHPLLGVPVIAAAFYSMATYFDWTLTWSVAHRSRDVADRNWQIHNYVEHLAGPGGQVIVVMPDISYLWQGIEDLIGIGLRGARSETLGEDIGTRSPFRPIRFVPSASGAKPGDVIVTTIKLAPGQAAPRVSDPCRSWVAGLGEDMSVQVCPAEHYPPG